MNQTEITVFDRAADVLADVADFLEEEHDREIRWEGHRHEWKGGRGGWNFSGNAKELDSIAAISGVTFPFEDIRPVPIFTNEGELRENAVRFLVVLTDRKTGKARAESFAFPADLEGRSYDRAIEKLGQALNGEVNKRRRSARIAAEYARHSKETLEVIGTIPNELRGLSMKPSKNGKKIVVSLELILDHEKAADVVGDLNAMHL